MFLAYTARICSRPCWSGVGTIILRSKRPGRNNAGSNNSTRLVAPITKILSVNDLNPSNSVNNAFKVASRSSLLPGPEPRFFATASISSKKIIAPSLCLRASSIVSRIRAAPTPTYFSTKSEPETL